MTKKYSKIILITLIFFVGFISYSQDIHFTFANAQNTNDGVDDYYEVDVMIQTINSSGSFKLGTGLLYFTYNTLAFGSNVVASSSFTVTQPAGYVCGQGIDLLAVFKIYGIFTINDNTASRVAWAFSQIFSSSTFLDNNVTNTAAKLCHLKVKYADANQDPMFLFEEGSIYDDQFFTACGSATAGATEAANCSTKPGGLLANDTFDSSKETLSLNNHAFLKGLTVYPNPSIHTIYIKSSEKLTKVALFNIIGQQVLTTDETSEVRVNHLEKGVYLLKLYSESASAIKKVVIK